MTVVDATSQRVIGVGVGPFNLGLAALLDPVPDVDATFFDAGDDFAWHAGLLIDGVSLQVPFLADLVTLADPTSRHSYLNYLHEHARLYRFYFYEHFHIPRREYDAYCRWVAHRLTSIRFASRVEQVEPVSASDPVDGAPSSWRVTVTTPSGTREELVADHVVLGVGTRPVVPECARPALGDHVFHSAEYLSHRAAVLTTRRVTVVGSGQSAAEIVADLLEHAPGTEVAWFTRSRGFFPMEYSKLGLEHFSPEYTSYFHALDGARRDEIRRGQDLLYKGISAETSNRIFDVLYERSIDGGNVPLRYAAACELRSVAPAGSTGCLTLHFDHQDQHAEFTHDTDTLVLATGYEPSPLPVAPGVLALDAHGRPEVTRDYRFVGVDGTPLSVYAQNAELHTHGVGAPDLGLGAHRNAVIVNAITGRDEYAVHDHNVFQEFGVPVGTTNTIVERT
ncbi:MAG: SidA/IucD/PvdA family monooxygenase [Acidimicrobiia bacterium]